ncbi:hypothetical protein [Inmirania thermothiophila]|uniref:Lipoprotein n=1 Tax=Inmirania thermothiophila TaxID=1750597 RepID=A0A3N1XZH5_9GAMM|nr:hypothetical protein [Inmirania thermothiophila]ROR31993.1 hypothetical protein EDC57_1175 [Inmirania thermothiophila]
MRAIGILSLALLVAGCAGTGSFRRALDGLVGRPAGEAVERLGYGYLEHALPQGRRALTWRRVETGVQPGLEAPTHIFVGGDEGDVRWITVIPGPGLPPEPYVITCEITLFVDESGIVRGWRAQGAACRGSPWPEPVLRSDQTPSRSPR